jgi:hypothetical protein
MATEIDIAVTTTTYDVTIVAEPNEYIVNITTGGGGGNQTLAQTLVLGNTTGGENILINDADAIELENTSLLKKGSYDFGGDGGISRICSNQYEDMWQSGFRHVFDQSGFIRHSTNCFDVIPDETFDNTLRFKVDSLWTLDNGTTYKCTDASTGAAVWEIYNNFIPNLTQVLTVGDISINNGGIGTDVFVTFQLGWELTEIYLTTQGAGTGGLFLDKDIIFPNNSTIRFQAGYADDNGNSETLDSYRFTTDAHVYYQGAEVTDITIQPDDYCMLKCGGVGGDGVQVWFLTITNRSSGVGGTVTSVGLTMPSAFTVTNSPITSSGDIAVTGAGAVSQYVRGDGTLANFPISTGGGSSLSFYLNGSVSQGTFGGVAFKEMDRTPILGAGTDFTINANGYIQSFITDAGVPNLLEIPAGNWNFETYFSASSNGGSPSFYVELYKWNGTTLSLIASSSANPEFITGGTNTDLYVSALAVPQTALLATDRLAVRIYVTHSGRTIKLHTEDNHLSQVITTFSTGLTALNGLTAQVQNLAVGTTGTDFAINSTTATHTFNLPTASASNRGALSSTDWTTFNSKGSGTVTSVAALTLGTTGTDLTSTVVTGTTTPVITLNVPTASAANRGALSSTDWSTFNNKQNRATLIFDSLQKAIMRDNYFWFVPNSISTGVAAGFGYSERLGGNTFTLSNNGTLLRGLIPFSSTATAGTIAFSRRNDAMVLTGLEVVFTRKIQFNSNVSGQRFFCGISKGNQFSAPTNVEPSTLTDIVGVCQLSSSTNMHVVHNDASGTATTIDLGSSYPCNDSQYNYYITIEQTTSSYIVTVERVTVSTGASISTTNTLSTNIPNYATGTIQLLTWISNNATAAIASYLDGGAIGNVKNQ